jgi:dUTP pyrophosphatase
LESKNENKTNIDNRIFNGISAFSTGNILNSSSNLLSEKNKMKIELKILDNLKNNEHFGKSEELINYRDNGPSYAHDGDAGLDLRACIAESVILHPGQSELIPTGLAAWIGSLSHEGYCITDDYNSVMAAIVPRSGLGCKHGVVVGNLVGVCDEGYQSEIFICAWNRSDNSYCINPGDRIAQMIYVPIIRPRFEIVNEFSFCTDRADGGFGSTGK